MKIGRLVKVDIRDLWTGEASHFTPWLASEENIALISEAIDLELELVGQEKNVGPFRADILCKNTLDDHYVLIENQLERTDHTHLGQLLTYAAGLDAVTIIWIARIFTEEHRAALDWLNRVTDDGINFFGIEIEAYKIGNSDPAPYFKIVSKPNDWTKAVKTAASNQNITGAKTINLEYWGAMKEYFEKTGTKLKCQKPAPQHYTNFAIGRANFYIQATVSVKFNFIRIDFIIGGPNAKAAFKTIKDNYEIEAGQKISAELNWAELPDKLVSIVSLKRNEAISDKKSWPEQHQWLMETVEKFDAFFRPIVRQL
jgi:hypothetical protein